MSKTGFIRKGPTIDGIRFDMTQINIIKGFRGVSVTNT